MSNEIDLCTNFDATIVDFLEEAGRVDFQSRLSNVYDVIYGEGPEKVMSRARDSSRKELEIGTKGKKAVSAKPGKDTLETSGELAGGKLERSQESGKLERHS